MVILLCCTSAFSEVIYTDFYAKILDWNFRLIDENSQILVVVFVSKLNFSFSFSFVDENCRICVVVVVFVTKINLLSSTKIFVFVVIDEKNTDYYPFVKIRNSQFDRYNVFSVWSSTMRDRWFRRSSWRFNILCQQFAQKVEWSSAKAWLVCVWIADLFDIGVLGD